MKTLTAEMMTVLRRALEPISWATATSFAGRHSEYKVDAANRALGAGLLESADGFPLDCCGGVVITEAGKKALEDGVYGEA